MNGPAWEHDRVEEAQRRLWEEKAGRHGDSPAAVGSESTAHKILRYERISRVFSFDSSFTLLDVGAGVGDYYGFLNRRYEDREFSYTGTEITQEFCRRARNKYPGIDIRNTNILTASPGPFDYVVLSGVFHQRGDVPVDDWTQFVFDLVARSFTMCEKGVSFNILSEHVDYEREGNYYGNLATIQEFIVDSLSRFFVMDHSYPLFEATFSVFKSDFIRASIAGFDKYF